MKTRFYILGILLCMVGFTSCEEEELSETGIIKVPLKFTTDYLEVGREGGTVKFKGENVGDDWSFIPVISINGVPICLDDEDFHGYIYRERTDSTIVYSEWLETIKGEWFSVTKIDKDNIEVEIKAMTDTCESAQFRAIEFTIFAPYPNYADLTVVQDGTKE